MSPPETDDLAARFRRFAAAECAGKSPLYAALAEAVADDERLLSLADHARAGQPAPNLLLAAVHALLRRTPDDPLAAHYPSLTSTPEAPAGAVAPFRAFCTARQTEIRALLARRSVSTNEVARCAALTLGFRAAARALGAEALHFLEIGASAGLNLLWDRYACDFGPAGRLGSAGAGLVLDCALRGDGRPELSGPGLAVLSAIGVDPDPLDPADPDDRDWLLALVWPELSARAARLRQALDLAAGSTPRVVRGDGIAFFSRYSSVLPAREPLCVYHSFTFNQIGPAAAEAFEAALTAAGRDRPVARIAMEWGGAQAPRLDLTLHRGGQREHRLLAYCDPHGAWIEWLA